MSILIWTRGAVGRWHGYRTQEQFSRAFRARFGITPHQFYEMVRRRDHAGLGYQAKGELDRAIAEFTELGGHILMVSTNGEGVIAK